MQFDRNRYFMIGLLVLLLGIQFRMIDSFTLNETSTRALHRVAQQSELTQPDFRRDAYMSIANPKKTISPPDWMGWALLTIGGVVSLHAFVLPRRDG